MNGYSVGTRNPTGRGGLLRRLRSSKDLIRRTLPAFAAVFLVVVGLVGGPEQVLAGRRANTRDPCPRRPGSAAVSQVSVTPSPPQRGERALRAIETVRMRRLIRELRADERQSRVIRETYNRGLARKHTLLRERAESLREMRGLMLAGDAVGVRERELAMDRLTRRFMEIEREIAESRWTTENQILEHLSPPQRVRYLLFNERFERELRERIETLRQTRPAQTPPAAPAPPPAEIPE